MEPEAARFRLFDSLAGFLRAAASPTPRNRPRGAWRSAGGPAARRSRSTIPGVVGCLRLMQGRLGETADMF
ncbi:MAG TPA: hypothetical protein VF486_10860, partial [Actinomycetes bacterium]